MKCSEKARQALLFGCAGLITAALFAGCQVSRSGVSGAAENPPDSAPSQPQRGVLDPTLEALLDRAEIALSEDRLSYPASDSALVLYERVLVLDPGNSFALRGLEKIAERYLEFAQRAAGRQQFAEARSMLARARLMDPDNSALEPTARQIRLLEGARRERVILDRNLLAQRSAVLAAPLQRLGHDAKRAGCRATITARNDAEGRWVYAEMSHAAGEGRIRAQMQIGSPPAVEIICIEQADHAVAREEAT